MTSTEKRTALYVVALVVLALFLLWRRRATVETTRPGDVVRYEVPVTDYLVGDLILPDPSLTPARERFDWLGEQCGCGPSRADIVVMDQITLGNRPARGAVYVEPPKMPAAPDYNTIPGNPPIETDYDIYKPDQRAFWWQWYPASNTLTLMTSDGDELFANPAVTVYGGTNPNKLTTIDSRSLANSWLSQRMVFDKRDYTDWAWKIRENGTTSGHADAANKIYHYSLFSDRYGGHVGFSWITQIEYKGKVFDIDRPRSVNPDRYEFRMPGEPGYGKKTP